MNNYFLSLVFLFPQSCLVVLMVICSHETRTTTIPVYILCSDMLSKKVSKARHSEMRNIHKANMRTLNVIAFMTTDIYDNLYKYRIPV